MVHGLHYKRRELVRMKDVHGYQSSGMYEEDRKYAKARTLLAIAEATNVAHLLVFILLVCTVGCSICRLFGSIPVHIFWGTE